MDIVERKRPRGTFLNLFDWPGKSRKKLFSSNISQLSEDPKQAKENVQRHSIFEVDQSVKNPRSDSSCCASSVTSDDNNVARAPNVVARLMGLECLPIQNGVESRFNPSLDPYFLRSSRQDVNVDDFDSVSLDTRTSKGLQKQMIERFQTETLPPRSAKPISISHNKLLSPIRNPGFVPSKNPAYVMEAASRMIDSSPRMVTRTRVVSSSDSSPVPLRIRDLKEKLEAAQKSGTRIDTTRNNRLKGEVKQQPSFSAQAKSTINQNLTMSSSSSGNKRMSLGQKEKVEAKNRAVKKGSSSLSTGKNVLKQNYQKQNCRDNNNQQSKKVMNKVVNKVLVESGSTTKSRKKSLPRSKKPRNNGVQESGIYEDKRIKRSEKSIKCNISIDGDSKDDQKRDMDVISFTFSSSIKGLSSHSQGIKQDLTDSSVRFNVIGGDSLNELLEKKLRELTSKIESSNSSSNQEESLSSISKDRVLSQSSLDKVFSESESVSDSTSFQKKDMIQGEEHEVSSISTLTEADGFELLCSKSFSDFRHDKESGMKQSSSDKERTFDSSNESHQTLDETDSSSSSFDWELEYITKILNSNQLMFQDFALTTSESLLPLSLFDEMEHSQGSTMSTKIERKTLFDCVNQCLAVKFERMLIGSCKGMMMEILLERRDLLVEEVNREVKRLKKMRDMMIDELVDYDMSCFEGRWISYEGEMFEEGIDIEGEIVSALVDDLVSDLLS